METIAVYTNSAMPHAAAMQENTDVAELMKLVKATLGRPLEQAAREKVLAAQAVLHRKQAQLTASLDRGEIGPDRYLTLLNRAVKDAMAECSAALGPERFKAVFGKEGKHPENLVDRDTFVAHEGNRQRA